MRFLLVLNSRVKMRIVSSQRDGETAAVRTHGVDDAFAVKNRAFEGPQLGHCYLLARSIMDVSSLALEKTSDQFFCLLLRRQRSWWLWGHSSKAMIWP